MPTGNNSPYKSQSSLQGTKTNAFMTTAVVEGKVIAVNPEDSTVDVALYGGQILRHVRVLLDSANTIAGFRYLSSIKNTNSAQKTQNGVVDKAILTHVADTIAVIVYVQGQSLAPRVIGFNFPIDAQMHIDEQGLAMFRHESGVYSLIDATGHHETHYPDGSYIIAATNTTPKTIKSAKGKQPWKIPTSPNINVTIHLAQGVDITIKNNKITLKAGSATLAVDGANNQVTASGPINGTHILAD